MDILPIITGLIDLAQKGEEYDEEYQSLIVTLETMRDSVAKIEAGYAYPLFSKVILISGVKEEDSLMKRVRKQLEEAQEMLANAPKKMSM